MKVYELKKILDLVDPLLDVHIYDRDFQDIDPVSMVLVNTADNELMLTRNYITPVDSEEILYREPT